MNKIDQEAAFLKAIEKLTLAIEMVTPDMATKWIQKQDGNRKLRGRKVDRLVSLLLGGRWFVGVGSIVFDEDECMIDGQHRLWAIVKSGISAPLVVVRGADPDAKYWIDTGVGRTGSDALEMAGVDSHQGTISTALSLILRYARFGKVNTLWRPENEDLRDAHQAYPDILASVEATKAARASSIWGSHGTFAFLHYVLSMQDAKLAEEFFRGVLSGIGITSEGDPRHLLRNRLIDETTRQNKISQHYVVSLAFKAWNLWREGEERKFLRVRHRGPSSEGLPDIGPVPGVWSPGAGSPITPDRSAPELD